MQYRRIPTSCGFSPSELLNHRQIRTRIDSLLPSPAHIAQGKQSKEAHKSQVTPSSADVAKVTRQYKAGDPVYALYYGPCQDKDPRWVPAIIKKSLGTRCFNVKLIPHGPMWRQHWEQLQPWYTTEEDNEPGDAENTVFQFATDHPMEISETVPLTQRQTRPKTMLPVLEYGPDNPRRSKRTRKTQERLCC
uniref:Uncharacterized protein n=1 Tax=Octopus bimaculoides TaxID=37653 RepID=A0A0L8I2S5_OCTBM